MGVCIDLHYALLVAQKILALRHKSVFGDFFGLFPAG